DVAGAVMLTHEALRLRARGGGLYLCNLKDGVRELLRRGGYEEVIGPENIFASKAEAIATIFRRLDQERCSLCTRRVFRECREVEFQGSGVMG
ncbi:MAG: STAS domain-containing protein, partial [Candidatus Competibacteraceae bacterium]|nr:STAS domain-containing protein [Candidatus Competibacteraceae bacterium]